MHDHVHPDCLECCHVLQSKGASWAYSLPHNEDAIRRVTSRYLRRPSLCALLGHFVQVVHVAAAESQQGSEFGEQDARPGADARAGPGDQSHFAPQGGHLQHTLDEHTLRQNPRKYKNE